MENLQRDGRDIGLKIVLVAKVLQQIFSLTFIKKSLPKSKKRCIVTLLKKQTNHGTSFGATFLDLLLLWDKDPRG